MSLRIVKDAGSANYNGFYFDAPLYLGTHCWRKDAEHWIWFPSGYPLNGLWMGSEPGAATAAYHLDPGGPTWHVHDGLPPAPTWEVAIGISYLIEATVEIISPASAEVVSGFRIFVTRVTIVSMTRVGGGYVPDVLQLALRQRDEHAAGNDWPPGDDTWPVRVPVGGSLDVPFGLSSFDWNNGTALRTVEIGLPSYQVNTGYTFTDDSMLGHAVSYEIDNSVYTEDAPTVIILAPANGATVSADVPISFLAQDDVALALVELKIDGAVVLEWDTTERNFAAGYVWDSTAVANGAHTITVAATDGWPFTTTATVVVIVDNAGGGADTTAPIITIDTPLNGATVSGTEPVTVTATDDVALEEMRFLVDGALLTSWLVTGVLQTKTYQWDTRNYSDGVHALRAEARDTSGNWGYHEISVTVANGEASAATVWVSCKWSEDPVLGPQLAALALAGRAVSRVLATAILTSYAPPEAAYGLRFGVDLDGIWTNFADCQTIIPDTIIKLTELASDGRLAIEFTPLVGWDTRAIASPVIDYQVISETQLLLLAAGPPGVIYEWNGVGPVSTWLTLVGTWAAGYTAIGFRVQGSRCYIIAETDDATGQPAILVQDLDTSGKPNDEAPYALEVASRHPHAFTAIETTDTGVVVGTDNGLGGDLWQIEANDVELLGSTIPGIRSLWRDGDAVWVGGADGKVYEALVERFSSGQDTVNAGYAYPPSRFALTGDAGNVYWASGTNWALLAIADMAQPRAVTVYKNRLWVGGDTADLYMYDFATGVWQKYTTLADWTSVTLLVNFGGFLCVFGVNTDGVFGTLSITSAHLTARHVDEVALAIVDTEAMPA